LLSRSFAFEKFFAFEKLFCGFLLMTRPVDERAWSDINPTEVTLFRFRNAVMKHLK